MEQLTRCPLCDSVAVGHLYDGRSIRNQSDKTSWPISSCRECTHSFMNPRPSWDVLQNYYDSSYQAYDEDHGYGGIEADVAEARRTGELRHVPIRPGLRLLDVGCGGGSFLKRAAALGAEVQGVEPSPHGHATAMANGIPVFHGQIDEFVAAQNDRRFDLITANHVVEHHPTPVEMLKHMGQLLADGGYIWFAVPNADCGAARSLQWRWHSCDLPYHLMQFSPASARRLVENAGLKIRRLYTYSVPSAVRASLNAELRHAYKIPGRLLERLPLDRLAARRARQIDARAEGEAIIVEATVA